MYWFFLSLRYIRSRIVSYLAMLAVALGVTAMIVVLSIMNGFIRQTREIARGTLSDLIVTPIDRSQPYEYYERTILGTPHVRAVSPHVNRQVILADPYTSQYIFDTSHPEHRKLNFGLVIGIDPEKERASTDFADYLAPGDELPYGSSVWVDDPEDPFSVRSEHPRLRSLPRVIVGHYIYDQLMLKKGEGVLTLLTYHLTGNPQDPIEAIKEDFVVAGAFRSGIYEFDLRTVYMHVRDLREAFRVPEEEISEICVRLDDYRHAPVVKQALLTRFRRGSNGFSTQARVETWEDRQSVFLGAVSNEKGLMSFILFLFLVFSCFVIFVILMMMVHEKTRDIGILNALGATRGGILFLFVVNSLVIAIVGCASGFALSLAICENLGAIESFIETHFGINFFSPDIYVFDELPVDMRPAEVAWILGSTLGLSILASLYPALRASWLDPVEALRHE